MKGRLIAIDGTDGSGKATQTSLLADKLRQMEPGPVEQISFPVYSSDSSALVRMYLNGQFGTNPEDVNPYAASTFYAVDRYASYKKDGWGKTYDGGGIIVSDRYTTANAIHQTAKLPTEQRQGFLEWLSDFEYNKMGIPTPDLVILLDMPTDITLNMMKARKAADESHVTDIHELDTEYLFHCHENALATAKLLGWTTITCGYDGKPRDIQDIHREVLRHVLAVLHPSG